MIHKIVFFITETPFKRKLKQWAAKHLLRVNWLLIYFSPISQLFSVKFLFIKLIIPYNALFFNKTTTVRIFVPYRRVLYADCSAPQPFFLGSDFSILLCDHHRKFFFTFFSCVSIDIMSFSFSPCICWRIPSFV